MNGTEPVMNEKQIVPPDLSNMGKAPFGISGQSQLSFEKEESGLDFNMDDLVKKIDAKIAELEEEEKKNKEQLKKHEEDKQIPVIGDRDKEILQENMPKNNELDLEDDDDEFFDDFFDQ